MEALEQIQYSLQAGLELELQKYHILMELNASNAVKMEAPPSPEIKQETRSNENQFLDRKNTTTNDTKNIPKNFGKAVIAFIAKNPKVTLRCLSRYGVDSVDFLSALKSRKKNLHSIK